MLRLWDWEFLGVPELEHVIFSAEALKNLRADGVTDDELFEAMLGGTDVRHRKHHNVLGRQYRDIRLVIKTYATEGTAAVCVNGYRVKP